MKRKLFYRASLILALLSFTFNTYAQCGPGQSELTLSIDFSGDAYPDEDGWRLINLTDGITVDSVCFGAYAGATGIISRTICADTAKSYVLKAYDDFGDGLDGSSWSIGYTYGSNIATIGTNNFNIASSLCNPNYSNNELADSTVAFMLQYVAPPACLAPSANAGPNSLTVNSAELAWIENGSATSWRVEWDTAGYPAGTARNSAVVMTDTFLTISGLIAQTGYDWAVKALCSATDSSSNSFGSFTTPCVGISAFPYTENFDGSLTNNVWDCWTVIDADNAGGTWEQANTYITARSGTWTAHGMGNNNDHLITPQLVLPAGTNMRMKVWDIVESSTQPNDYSVLVSTTGTNIADFTDTLASYTVTNTTWTERTIDLSAYTGQTIYISMWQSYSNSSFWGFGLDDFLIEQTPNCLAVTPNSNLSLTDTSATLSWIENGTATQWEVQWDTAGNPLNSTNSIIVNVDTFTTLLGLTAESNYNWRVRAICGVGDSSTWSSNQSFLTPCAPVTAPFFEDFESFGTISGMNGTYGCYTATRQNTTNDWNIGTSASFGTGPSSAYSGSRYLYLEASGGVTGAEATLTSPTIDVSGLTLPMIEFYYHMFGDNRGQLGNLYIDVIDGGVTTTVDSIINEQQTSQADPWKRRAITLPSFGNTIQIVIRGTRGTTSQYGDISVDDFAVIEAPTCPVPSMLSSVVISTDSAALAWTNNSTATSFEIEYGVTGFTLGTGNTIVTSSNPDTLTGLMPATTYDWYVRAICSSTDTSIWSTSGSFVTPCAVITNFPHTESFNTTSTPNCWSETGSESWRYSTSAGYTAGSVLDHTGNNGNYAWIDGSSPSGPNQISRLLTEFYDVSSLTTPQLEFFIYSHYAPGLPTYNTLEVEMYNGATWDTLWVNQGSLEDRWRRVAVDLSAYTITGDIQFRFSITENGSTAFYNDILLDDITVQGLAPCNTPTIDPITTVSSTSATINWSSNGYSNDFQIEFGPAGFTLGSGVDSVIVGDTTVDITGLMSRTSYDVYLRSICGILDTSSWTTASSFTTPIAGPRTLACGSSFEGNIFTEEFDNTTSFTGNINAGSGSWLYDDNNTSSGNTGPSAPHSGSHYIFFETSTGGLTTGSIVSPVIDLSSVTTAAELSFWLHAYGATTGTLDVGVSTSATGPFTNLFTNTGEIQNDELDPFVNVGVNLDAYLGQSIYIEFSYTRGSSFTGDLAIDLVQVSGCLSCPAPTNTTASNATSNTVDLAWTENGAATAWEIEYGPIGFTPGTGTMVAASSNPYTLTGLSNYTTYDYVVRSRCSPTDSSSYSSATTFFTGLPMSGVYTIDSTSTAANNFISFSDLAAIINNVGVSGAVTVNVAPGTYNDQFSLGIIPGSSDTNTITIDGGSAATLTHDKSIRNSTLNLDGTSDITIENMTISATGGSDSWAIHIWNGANDVTIDSNIITTPLGTTFDVAGIMVSGSETSDNSTGNVSDLTISNNTVTGGERGISVYGSFTASARSQNLTIHNNDIQNADDNGLYIVGYNNVSITDNYVDGLNNAFSDGMYSSDLENFTITGNQFKGGDNGLEARDYNFDNTVTSRSIIANNMFIGGDDGLYLDDVEETDIFHNSLVGDDYGIFVNDQANLDIRNNIFYSNGGDIPFYYLDAATVAFTTFDYNIFYTSGANIARSSSGNYADVTALQAGLGGNTNSLSGDPVFLNPTSDLHVGGTLANDVGDNTVGILVDIDGDTRPLAPSTTVDIGADEFTPAACAFPSGLITAGITDTAATFNWTENGTATQWEVEYGISGFTQGTGTVVVVMTDTFTTVGGLMANTSYDWYVRAICTGSNSLWSASSNFSTLCGAFATPFVEDWETTSNACWIQSTTDQRDWTFDQNGTGSTGTGPSGDNTPGLAGAGTYIYLETSGVALGQTADIQTSVDLSGLINPSLKFDYHMWGSTMGTLNIDIEFPVGSGNYTNVWTLSGDQGNMWISSTIGLSAYANQTVGVRVQGISGGSYTSDMAVDNLSFEEAPSCPDVTSLTVDSLSSTAAKVTWNENGSATQWEVEWGLAGYTVGTSINSAIVNVDTFEVITGLTANTNYDYNVRAICAPNDTSAWVGSSFFTGYCTPAPVSTDGNGIVGIAFDTVNNVTGLEPGGYGDYTSISGDVRRDSTVALDITYATGFTYVTEVWIDWNDDLDFDDAGENVYSGVSLGTNPTTLNASFVVPTNAPIGQHRMRVGGADTGPPTPCYTGSWASFEDYTVNVLAPVALAPISLPITWDNGATVDLSTVDFGGNVSALVADPTNASNTVLQSEKGIGAQVWAGTTFGDSLASAIAFAANTTTIRAVVYSPTVGTPIRLKVEDAANPAISVETEVLTTVANVWDTLSFNLSLNVGGTPAINFANTYNKMSIFYNFGTSPTVLDTFYVDLVEDVSVNPVPPVPAKAPIALPITWDDTANVDYSVIDFGGIVSTSTADPTNATNIVLQSIKDSSAAIQTWGGTTLGDSLSAPIPFSAGNTTIRAVVYSAAVGIPVRLKVEDYNNPAISVETEVLTTVANAWDTLNFDMTLNAMNTPAINFANTYNKMSIFYNFGTVPALPETYYVDYVEFGNPPVVPTPDPYYPIGTINTEDATTGVADSLNVDCFTSGIVAGVDLDGNAGINFTIIDMASGSQEGIVIFNFVDINNYVVTEGDSIMVHGYVDQFNGLTQIRVDSISVLATGVSLPAPIAVSDLDETTEAKWLSLTGNWVSLSTSGAFSSNLDLTNGTDTIIMRIDSDTDVNDSLTASGMPIVPGDTICGLLGIGGQFDNSAPRTEGYQIFPMRWSDLTICRLSTGIDDTEFVTSEFKLVPNPTNGLFEIRSSGFNNAEVNISIRDISGRLISSEIVNNANGNFTKSFDFNEESAGIYFITIIDGESVINEKLILK